MSHTCLYCEQWMGSRVVNVVTVNKVSKLTKHCLKRRKDIESDSRPCRRFKPAKIFYCSKLNCRKDLVACLHGHAYSIHGKYPALYSECEKCRQYERTIRPMCDKYGISPDRQIVELPRRKTPKGFKLPRRDKKKNGMPKDFILPRRKSKELWRIVVGFENYSISNFGNIKNSKRILKPSLSGKGYPSIILTSKNKKRRFLIHLLVLKHFGPPKPSYKHQCNHKDGDKTNNHISNLEWCTPSENIRHSFKNGLSKPTKLYGRKNPQSKLTKKKVKLIRSLYKTSKYNKSELGRIFNISHTQINNIINKKQWG